jgi:hypothetical protein
LYGGRSVCNGVGWSAGDSWLIRYEVGDRWNIKHVCRILPYDVSADGSVSGSDTYRCVQETTITASECLDIFARLTI